MTVQELLDEVRHTIGDTKKTKYTDDRLLILYNEGMRDIVKSTNIFRATTSILVENGITKYTLPTDVFYLTRVSQNGEPIVMKSFEDMYNEIPGWTEDEEKDTILAVVYDEQNINQITIYPRLNGIGGTYFKLPDGTSVSLESGTEGAVTYLADNSQNYTAVVEQSDPNYGALVSISYDWYPLVIQYVRRPAKAILTDESELPDIYEAVIKYYIAGTVLFDDSNNENSQKGALLLQKYNAEMLDMKKKSSVNFHRVNRNTGYRTPFND